MKLPDSAGCGRTEGTLDDLRLHTVCQSAKCPNKWECFSRAVATFLIMGNQCTRNCRFCNITQGTPAPLEADEPDRISEAVRRLGLKHVVVTSVTRDDLPDGGAAHFAAVIRTLRRDHPHCTIEVLIPDFQGDPAALLTVLDAGPDILNHNVETVPALYPKIRPQADYQRSLDLLRRVKDYTAHPILSKSGLMLGLGEELAAVRQVIADLAAIHCDIVTIGQYMRPSREHPPVLAYVTPAEFDQLAEYGASLGIPHMFCAPLVRSSYNAAQFAEK